MRLGRGTAGADKLCNGLSTKKSADGSKNKSNGCSSITQPSMLPSAQMLRLLFQGAKAYRLQVSACCLGARRRCRWKTLLLSHGFPTPKCIKTPSKQLRQLISVHLLITFANNPPDFKIPKHRILCTWAQCTGGILKEHVVEHKPRVRQTLWLQRHAAHNSTHLDFQIP
jgi:hypothetical protein